MAEGGKKCLLRNQENFCSFVKKLKAILKRHILDSRLRENDKKQPFKIVLLRLLRGARAFSAAYYI